MQSVFDVGLLSSRSNTTELCALCSLMLHSRSACFSFEGYRSMAWALLGGGGRRAKDALPFRRSTGIVLTTNDCLGNRCDKDFFLPLGCLIRGQVAAKSGVVFPSSVSLSLYINDFNLFYRDWVGVSIINDYIISLNED